MCFMCKEKAAAGKDQTARDDDGEETAGKDQIIFAWRRRKR